MKIILSGNAGSGKTTIGNILSEILSTEFLSVGNITRKIAEERGMDIYEFQKYLKSNPDFDIELDKMIVEKVIKLPKYILDYRLGFHFLPESFKVLLTVSDEVAFKRTVNRNQQGDNHSNDDIKTVRRKMIERNTMMRDRFIVLYKADFSDPMNYNLVLDSDVKSPQQIVEEIMSKIEKI